MDTEKDKRKALPSRWNWIYGRGLAYLVGVLALLVGIHYVFLDQYSQEIKSVSLLMSTQWLGLVGLILSIFDRIIMPVRTVILFPEWNPTPLLYYAPTTFHYLIGLGWIILRSVVLVYSIRLLQRRRILFRILLSICVVMHLGLLIVIKVEKIDRYAEFLTLDHIRTCENIINSVGLRVDDYEILGGLESPSFEPGLYQATQSVVSISLDTGQTWYEQFRLYSRGLILNCEESGGREQQGDFVWFATPQILFLTHSNGNSWEYWVLDEAVLGLPINPVYAIRYVEFSSQLHGKMLIGDYYDPKATTYTLTTTDGGRTWEMMNP